MKKRFLIAHLINVIATTNFLGTLVIQEDLTPSVRTASFVMAALLFMGSTVAIIVFSNAFLKTIENGFEHVSGTQTFLMKFIMSTIPIAMVYMLVVLAVFYNYELFKVALLFGVLLIWPVWAIKSAQYVVMNEVEIRVYNFSGGYVSIAPKQLCRVTTSILGSIHRMRYKDETGSEQTKYFYPKSRLSSDTKGLEKLKEIAESNRQE
jgi:hypothetical protein